MRRLILLVFAVGCTSASPKRSISDVDIDVPWESGVPAQSVLPRQSEQPTPAQATDTKTALQTTHFHLTWQGKRIGEAREVFHRSERGIRLIRHEEIRITRGGVPVDSETEILIDTDLNLRATRVELRARFGAVVRKGQAIRSDDGSWIIALDGEAVRKLDKSAVPLELVPYLLAQNGTREFRGTVLLAGYGFATTEMRLGMEGRKGQAVLVTPWGNITTSIKMAGNGALLQADTGSTRSVRVDDTQVQDDFQRVELPGSSTIPVAGKGQILLVNNVSRQPPPAFGGQSVRLRKRGWQIQYDQKPARVSRQVAALVRQVDTLLTDSHDAPGAGAEDAVALGRGDCTAHATLFVDMAAEQQIEARLVTGFRVDGKRLVRHRWAAVRSGDKWIQVDPTFGEAPVRPGTHLALARHGDSTAEIALVDEAVFTGLDRAKAVWTSGLAIR